MATEYNSLKKDSVQEISLPFTSCENVPYLVESLPGFIVAEIKDSDGASVISELKTSKAKNATWMAWTQIL